MISLFNEKDYKVAIAKNQHGREVRINWTPEMTIKELFNQVENSADELEKRTKKLEEEYRNSIEELISVKSTIKEAVQTNDIESLKSTVEEWTTESATYEDLGVLSDES